MAATLELVLDCADPGRLEPFWAEALGYLRRGSVGQYISLAPPPGEPGPALILQGVAEPKTVKNRMHLDIQAADAEAEVIRLVGIGATLLQEAPVEEYGGKWFLLADPDGNEFCVCQY